MSGEKSKQVATLTSSIFQTPKSISNKFASLNYAFIKSELINMAFYKFAPLNDTLDKFAQVKFAYLMLQKSKLNKSPPIWILPRAFNIVILLDAAITIASSF